MISLNTTRFEGLQYTVYSGYMDDNVNYFSTATLYTNSTTGPNKGLVLNIPSVDVGTNNCVKTNQSVSVQWLGYLKSNYSGTWTFLLNSDDCAYLWLGDNAVSGYTQTNALVKFPGLHGWSSSTEKYNTIVLNDSTYYPIRIQLGQNTGNIYIRIGISHPNMKPEEPKYNHLGYFYFFDNGTLNP